MKKNRILYFLLVVFLILSVTACGKENIDTNKKTNTDRKDIETINNKKTASQEEEKNIKEIKKEEIKVPSREELIDLIFNAETALLALCVDGYDAEFHGTEKKEFEQVSEEVHKYYTKDYLYPSWKDFYDNQLSDWGFGMGEIFIFSDYDTIKNSFAGMSSKEGQMEVYLNYDRNNDNEYYGSEDEMPKVLKYTYVLIQTDGKWLIDDIFLN